MVAADEEIFSSATVAIANSIFFGAEVVAAGKIGRVVLAQESKAG